MMVFSLVRSLRNANSRVPGADVAGTLHPRTVGDIQTWLLFEKKRGNVYCVGSLSRDKYMAVPAATRAVVEEIIAMLDGSHSLDEIKRRFAETKHQEVDVKQLYVLLRDADLLEDPRSDRVSESEFKRLSIELASLDLTRLYGLFHLLGKRVVSIAFLIVSLGVIVAGLHALPLDVAWSTKYYRLGDSYSLGLLLLALGGFIALLLHELSHGWVATVYGLNPKKLTMALYLGFMMFFYLEIRGLYTVKPATRIKVWAAGAYANLFLACLALLARQVFPLSEAYDQVCMKFAIANLLTVAGNLIPFVPTDGYFILSTLTKTVNLRTNALREFGNLLLRRGARLGVPVAAYGVVSMFIILNAFLMQVRWMWQMIHRLYTKPPSDAPGEYAFTLFFVLLFVLSPLVALLARRKRIPPRQSQGG